MFEQDFLSSVKSKVDCKHVYTVLTGGSVNKNNARCIHPERHKNGDRNPSLVISPQGFKCMVPTCAIHGDCFQMVREKNNCGFEEAVVYICALYGITLPILRRATTQIKREETRAQPRPTKPHVNGEIKEKPQIIQVGMNYLPQELTDIKEVENFSKFCTDAYVNLLEDISAQAYLSSRGIGMETIKECVLGYEKKDSLIVVPYMINYKIVYYSARSIKDKKFYQPAGHIPCPLGFDNLRDNRVIYIAEGLFDYLTLREHGYAAIGVPGANNWHYSREWNSLLLGNKIMLCFHADEEGWKANKILADTCQKLSVPYEIVDWKKTRNFPEVKDLNDWVTRGRSIDELFHNEKKYYISDVKEAMGELIDLSHYPDVPDLVIASLLATLMQGDPFWLLLVGPPSVGKTEIIRSVNNAVSTYFINRISPNTLTSGYTKTEYADVITRIVKPTTFCITDFGSFLSFHPQDMQKVMQQLRDIYDGRIHVEYGNGKIVDWSGKVGIIGGITPEIERHSSFIGRLGDRFLYCRMAIPEANRTDIAIRALKDNINEEKLRKNIQDVTTRFVDSLIINIKTADKVVIPEYIQHKIAYACDLFSRARTAIARMHDMEKTIEYKPEHEFIGRVARAFKVLIKALAFVRGRDKCDMNDYKVVLDICHGSIPSLRLEFLHEAYKIYCRNRFEWITTAKFGEQIGKDSGSARFHLRNLLALGLIDLDTDSKREHKWKIREETARLIEGSDFFEKPQGERE